MSGKPMPMHDRTMWKPSVKAICWRAATRSSAASTHRPFIAPTVPVGRYRRVSSAHLLPSQPVHPELPDLLQGRVRPGCPRGGAAPADRSALGWVVEAVFAVVVGRPADQALGARGGRRLSA